MDAKFNDELLIKAEIEHFFEPAYFESSIPTKCGIIFICSDSTYYIKCIVDNCTLSKHFYEINDFSEHIGTNHQHIILSKIPNKTEPIEPINRIQVDETENNESLTEIDDKIVDQNDKVLANENPLEIHKKKINEYNIKDNKCGLCGKEFLKPNYLKKHMKRGCVAKEVNCLICNRTFKNNSYLRFHMVVHETKSKPIIREEIHKNKCAAIIKNKVSETTNYMSEYQIADGEKYDLKKIPDDLDSNISNEKTFSNVSLENAPLIEQKLSSDNNAKLTRTCHICNKTFQSRKYLRRHIKLHSTIKPIKNIPCPKCNKIFKYDHHLRFHMVVHDVEHKCSDCDRIFKDRTSLQRHVVSHLGEKLFKCERCNSKFSLNEYLQRHIKKMHESEMYECSECKQHFANKRQFENHKLEECGNCVINDLTIENPDLVKEQKIHKCIICNKIFETNRLHKRHMQTHNKKSEEPIPCPKCNKSFKYEHHLKMHVVAHDKIHKCSECGKIYANRRALLNHVAYHGGERQLKCELCDTWCFTKIQLKRHISDVHCEKKYECERCGKKFRKKHTLTGHIRTHTREKYYVCEICGMSFFTPFLLNSHIKRHTNQRDFKCTFEGCDKTFFNRGALVDHEVTHTKLKPFFCTVEGCNSRFTLRSGLVKHKKLHSNVKNYICKICGKAYAQSPGLYAHMKTHGKPLPVA